jgi:cytochrome c6
MSPGHTLKWMTMLVLICVSPCVLALSLHPHPSPSATIAIIQAFGTSCGKMSTAFLVAAMISPGTALAADTARGATIFNGNCASCHVGGGNVINEQRTLQKLALDKFVGGTDQDTLVKFVKTSMRHNNLIFFNLPGGKLTEQDYVDVTTYIADQATGDKW